MNHQDPIFNPLPDKTELQDKPASPIITGTSSLEDDFVISEAGEGALFPTEENTATENPLLTDDPKAKSHHQTKIDPVALSSIQLPEYATWNDDNITPSILFKGTTFSQTIKYFVTSLTVGILLTFIAVMINESVPELICLYIFPLLTLFLSISYLLSLFVVKRNYRLRITIHDSEIILQEDMDKNSPCYVFPRDSSCSVEREKCRYYILYTLSIYSKDNFYNSTCALLNTESECIINLINNIISASVKIPVHPETPANPSSDNSIPNI